MILPLAQKQQTIFCYYLLLQYICIKSMLLLLSQISTNKTAKYLKKVPTKSNRNQLGRFKKSPNNIKTGD